MHFNFGIQVKPHKRKPVLLKRRHDSVNNDLKMQFIWLLIAWVLQNCFCANFSRISSFRRC